MMPKKVILLISAVNCDVLKFVLETRNPYRVIQASGEEDAVRLFGKHDVAAALIRATAAADMKYADRMTQLCRAMSDRPVMIFDARDLQQPSFADVTLAWNAPMATLVERLKVLAVRKRGPKKKLAPKVTIYPQEFSESGLQPEAVVL